MQTRRIRQNEERELGKRQAEIWEKDTEAYNELENKKANYILNVNKKH
jgi:hypothetical protein